MARLASGKAVVDARKFGGHFGQAVDRGKAVVVARRVDHPFGRLAHRGLRVERGAMHIGEEREHVVLCLASDEMDFAALLPGVEHVAGKAIVAAEPADVGIGDTVAAGDQAQIDRHGRVEAEMGQALFEPFPTADRGHDVEHEIILRDPEIVHHAVIGCLEPHFADQRAVGRDFHIGHIVAAQTAGGIADRDHVAIGVIDLGMRGKGLPGHAPAKLFKTQRFHADRVQQQRRAVFFHRPELAGKDKGIGVGGRADLACNFGCVGQGIAIGAKQGMACRMFKLPLARLGPALAEIDLTVVDMKPGDHAVAVERDVVTESGRELRIRLNAVERTGHTGRYCAFMCQIGDVGFDPRRRVESGKCRCLWKMGHGHRSQMLLYVELTILQGIVDGKTKRDTCTDHPACRGRR